MSLSLGILLTASVAIDLSSLEAAARARVDADRLHGELLVRLNEQGYSARSAGLPASYRIALRSASPEELILVVSGAQQRSEAVEVGPASVLHLAVIQRAMILLADLPPADTPPTRLARVHVRLRQSPGLDPDSRALQRIAVMVVEDGFELVSRPDRAEWLVCAVMEVASVSIWAGRGPAACEGRPDAVARSSGVDGDAMADRVARLARAALRDPDRVAAAPVAAPIPDPRFQWSAAVSGGALVRRQGTDPVAALSAQLGRDRGIGAAAWLRVLSSGEKAPSVYEVMGTVGPAWRIRVGTSAWTAALTGGLLHQRFEHPGNAIRRTTYTDWVVHASMDVTLALGRGWHLRVGGLAGRSAHDREHQGTDGTWRRGAHQLGLDAGLSFLFR